MKSYLAQQFRSEAATLRRLQLAATRQADRERAAREAGYLEGAAELLDRASDAECCYGLKTTAQNAP